MIHVSKLTDQKKTTEPQSCKVWACKSASDSRVSTVSVNKNQKGEARVAPCLRGLCVCVCEFQGVGR